MTYICLDCLAVFDEPNFRYEKHWWLDPGPSERFALCPDCGSEAFVEAAECSRCGRIFSAYDLDEDDLCDDCREGKIEIPQE